MTTPRVEQKARAEMVSLYVAGRLDESKALPVVSLPPRRFSDPATARRAAWQLARIEVAIR
jgi:hypothetical protein